MIERCVHLLDLFPVLHLSFFSLFVCRINYLALFMLQDRVIQETADKRNELESYVYAMRDKLVGTLQPYIEGEEAKAFGSSLTAAEDW